MKEIKLIIFDLDGTLVDAYPAIIRSFSYVMQKLKYSKQDSLTIRRAVGWGDINLLRPFIKEKDLSLAVAIYRRHHRLALLEGSRLFPGVIEVLDYLRNREYRLAVASNRPTRFSAILIRHLKLKRYFDYILCADTLKHIKPHPQILKKIMQRFKVRPIETLYVGDMYIDAQAGRRARVKTIIVTTGSSSKQEITKENPYRTIDRISGLKGLL